MPLTISFERISPTLSIVRRDGDDVRLRVRSDVDFFAYVVERVDGREIMRVDMADEHPRTSLELAILHYLDQAASAR